MKVQSVINSEALLVIEQYEKAGLGGRKIWVARDGNGCLYSYTKKPKWSENCQRWVHSPYGTFINDVFPWLKPGCCAGFEIFELESVKV